MGFSNSKARKQEVDARGSPKVPLDNYNESSKGVCKLIIKEFNQNATGFFLSDILKNKYLITNYHVISEYIVCSNVTIIIEIYNKKKYELKLNKNERYIKAYKDPEDITIIQINDLEALCSNVKFLSIDLNYKKGYDIYVNKDIYLLGHPLGKSVECSPGKITSIKNNAFKHNCTTDNGSPGSPIILVFNSTVIGIHKTGIIKEKINIGTFLGTIFDHKDNLDKDKKSDNANSNNNNKNQLKDNDNLNIPA